MWNVDLREALLGLPDQHSRDRIAVAAYLLAWILQRLGVPVQEVYSAGKHGENTSYGQLRATI